MIDNTQSNNKTPLNEVHKYTFTAASMVRTFFLVETPNDPTTHGNKEADKESEAHVIPQLSVPVMKSSN